MVDPQACVSGISDDDERLILATGRYIGEGFDDQRLDTLFLTMPISWKGTLAQYVGRLHRQVVSQFEFGVIFQPARRSSFKTHHAT
jgi:superfamily II DNA or RNA helicase